MQSSRFFASFAVLVGLVAGCGDDGGASGGTGGAGGSASGGAGQGGNLGSTTSQGGSSTGPECEPPASQPGASNDVPVTSVTAIAKDENGSPIANFSLQLCGTDNCLYADTNTIGQATFTTNVGTVDRPMFKPGDSLVYGKIGYPYLADSPNPLPGFFPKMVDSGKALDPGTDVSAADVTIAIPAGGAVVVDDLIYDEPAKQTFRAASLSANQLATIPELAGFAALYTLGPIDTLFCPPAKLTVPNSGLPAGATVEIFAQELAVGEHFGGYGEWSKIADGVVSADGATISTTDDTGLPALLTIAIKAAP
jgi:hypothetical protein